MIITYVNFIPKVLCKKKYENCLQISFEPCFKISLVHKKSITSRNKDILNTVQITKIEDLEHFLIKTLPPQKIVPCKSFSYLNMSAVFSLHVVLFALFVLF